MTTPLFLNRFWAPAGPLPLLRYPPRRRSSLPASGSVPSSERAGEPGGQHNPALFLRDEAGV